MRMAEFRRGAKAGAVSGIIYGPISWLFANIGLNLPYGTMGNWVATMDLSYLTCIISNIIVGALGGLIFGLFFAVLFDKLPGKTSDIKAFMISILFWITFHLVIPVLNTLRGYGFESFYWDPFDSSMVVIGMGASILWGWLLGSFWDRLCPEPQAV